MTIMNLRGLDILLLELWDFYTSNGFVLILGDGTVLINYLKLSYWAIGISVSRGLLWGNFFTNVNNPEL